MYINMQQQIYWNCNGTGNVKSPDVCYDCRACCSSLLSISKTKTTKHIAEVNTVFTLNSYVCFLCIFRFIQEDWETCVPWIRQCWKNNTPAHAQR